MNPTWEDPIPDEDEDDNAYDKGFSFGRDAVIFLIDATRNMFCPIVHDSEEKDTPMQLALKCARTSLTNKIILGNKDLTGIVLFGTDKTRNSRNDTDFKHIYVFQELAEPGAEKILETEKLMSLDVKSFEEKYGFSRDFSLADALWVCSIMFSNCSSKHSLSHRRILLFTADDQPHRGDDQLQLQAKTKARDLHESGVDIDLMHMQLPGRDFDPSAFYRDIALTAEDEEYKLPDASTKLDDLLTRVRCKEHRKRPLGSLTFTLGKDVSMAFKLYKLVVPSAKPTPVKLYKENNAELTSASNLFLADTGEILLPSDTKKYQEYGGKKIYLTDDEAKQIRHFGEPGLLLLGFKPRSCLKDHHHVRPSLFLYPDERGVEGSVRLAHALLIQCRRREYVPVCRCIMRKNDPPKIVALLPQEERVDGRGLQTRPPGFHAVFLPFTEDLRNLKQLGPEQKLKHRPPAPPLVDKAKEIIRKLQFAYEPDLIENPVLQKHWRNIEALALNRDAPEEIVDYTLPTKDVIEKRAGKLIDEYRDLLRVGNSDSNSSNSCSYPAKRSKLDDTDVPADLQQETASGQLTRYKVNILKEFCKRHGIKCGSKKAEIIEAITRYYGQ